MPIDYRDYPADWRTVSKQVRFNRAFFRCECTGQCGISHSHEKGSRCPEIHRQCARNMRGRVILTAAHTCNCVPLCSRPDHLLALCQACHLRFDLTRHKIARYNTIHRPGWTPRAYRRSTPVVRGGIIPEIGSLSLRRRTQLTLEQQRLDRLGPSIAAGAGDKGHQ